jgi:putative ABC transport system permease protein
MTTSPNARSFSIALLADGLWRDVQYALRSLRNRPSFTALAILTLAIGMGAATMIFSVIQSVLLDPFPYTDAEKIVGFYIHDVTASNPFGRSEFTPREFLTYQQDNRVFDDVIGSGNEDVLYTTNDGVEYFNGSYVTPNIFQVLGVPALLGRVLTPSDAAPSAPRVFVMSYKLWIGRFSADPNIVGQTFILNGTPSTLVGVMPRRFTKRAADIWRAQAPDPASPQTAQQTFQLQGHLKAGVTMRQVEEDLNGIAHRLAQVFPRAYPARFDVRAETWLDSLVRQFRTTLYTLAAAVGLLLLIGCGNVANMLLVRATAREREMAIRASVGASRGRIIRQLLVESLVLALAGVAGGCLLAYAGIDAIVRMLPETAIPGEAVISINMRTLVFSLAAGVITACLFGSVPAFQITRKDFVESLKGSGKGVGGGFRKAGLRNALVIAEVALSLVLLTGAGLLMRSFVALQALDLGFSPDHVLVSRVPFPRGQYQTIASKQRFFESLSRALATVPGATGSGFSTTLPPFGGVRGTIDLVGTAHAERWTGLTTLCNDGYFSTMGLHLRQGRLLSETDVHNAWKVAVVNETLVKRYLGGQDPLGRKILLPDLESLPAEPIKPAAFEIVGVVSDANNQGLRLPALPEVFIPHTITGAFDRLVVVKTTGNPAAMIDTLRRTIWSLDRNIALTRTDSLDNFMKRYLYADQRFSMLLLGLFASVGLILVSVGIYSVIAYTVARQSQEIAVRIALGASRPTVCLMVLWMGGRLLVVGVAIGLIASVGLTRTLSAQLTSVSPHDPLTLTTVIGVIALVGLAACYVPASRAMRVNPIVALRSE